MLSLDLDGLLANPQGASPANMSWVAGAHFRSFPAINPYRRGSVCRVAVVFQLRPSISRRESRSRTLPRQRSQMLLIRPVLLIRPELQTHHRKGAATMEKAMAPVMARLTIVAITIAELPRVSQFQRRHFACWRSSRSGLRNGWRAGSSRRRSSQGRPSPRAPMSQ